MDSADQTSHNRLEQEALVKSTSQEGTREKRSQADAHTSTHIDIMDASPAPLIERTNEQDVRDMARIVESKAYVTVVYPDLYQVPSSSLQATGAFQLANTNFFIDSTAQIAANSPRYRRRSSTFIDGVHDLPDERASPMAPAQLYSTMSGRLFHSGRIAIVLVGPPARGKT